MNCTPRESLLQKLGIKQTPENEIYLNEAQSKLDGLNHTNCLKKFYAATKWERDNTNQDDTVPESPERKVAHTTYLYLRVRIMMYEE
jgi:hypothetical protein